MNSIIRKFGITLGAITLCYSIFTLGQIAHASPASLAAPIDFCINYGGSWRCY